MSRLAGVVLVLAIATPAALAQEPSTRAELLRTEREEKAKALAPPEHSFLERTLLRLENGRALERLLSPPEGFYPRLGTIKPKLDTITPGGGFSFGPGYRYSGLFGGVADFNTFGAVSLQRYWMIDARLTLPRLAGGRVYADVGAQRYDFPNEEFFGIGPNSNRGDEVTYGLQNFIVGADGGVRPRTWLSLGARADWLTPRVSGGAIERSIDTLFDDLTTPGLELQPDYFRYGVYADLNYRQPRGNPRRGGRYMVAYDQYDDRTHNRFTFQRVDADLQQYLPIFSERRVLALRAFSSLSTADEGNRVPFYLQRTLGGPDDLRGFRRFRFRDTNILLLQAEYRWEIFTAVDGAIFYDAGAVAPRREDLSLGNLESDYGLGIRVGTVNGIFLRVEGAFGSSGGKHFILRFGNAF